ncbi:MAG: hypothetical protein HUK22_06435, partial [Thermoguttaceae bacterium]|nr:hypothetical protein [Thermoguttaceae bacterium]
MFVSLATVVCSIVFLRIGAFLALLFGALLVSFWSAAIGAVESADWASNVGRVATELGVTTGKIGALIVFGTIIGKCMTDAGSAERIVRSCRNFFGEKRIPAALAGGAFLLSIPVFYDATFYLLLPLAKSAYRAVRKNYVFYLLCVGLAATISHTSIPPTPGPVAVAETLGVSLSSALGVGLAVGICLLPVAVLLGWALNKILPNPEIDPAVRAEIDGESANSGVDATPDDDLPNFWFAIAPIFLPVVLIATASILRAAQANPEFAANVPARAWNAIFLLGDSNVALGLSAIIAASALFFPRKRRTPLSEMEKKLNAAISAAGTIILITSAGGAYGAMLRASGIGERIQELFGASGGLSGGWALTLAFLATALLKTAQGSSTTAMITAASIFASMNLTGETLGCHPAYLCAAIGVGSSVVGWMNDSGFCLFSRSSGIREVDCLKVWTVGTGALGCAGFIIILILSRV